MAVALRAAHSVGTTWDAQPGAVVSGHQVGPSPVTARASTSGGHDEQDAGRHLPRRLTGREPAHDAAAAAAQAGPTRAPPRR